MPFPAGGNKVPSNTCSRGLRVEAGSRTRNSVCSYLLISLHRLLPIRLFDRRLICILSYSEQIIILAVAHRGYAGNSNEQSAQRERYNSAHLVSSFCGVRWQTLSQKEIAEVSALIATSTTRLVGAGVSEPTSKLRLQKSCLLLRDWLGVSHAIHVPIKRRRKASFVSPRVSVNIDSVRQSP